MHRQTRRGIFHVLCLLDKRLATDFGQALLHRGAVICGPPLLDGPLVMVQADTDIEVAQRNALDHIFQVIEFSFLGAHKLAPRRHIVKQVAHLDGRAHTVRRRRQLGRSLIAPLHPETLRRVLA